MDEKPKPASGLLERLGLARLGPALKFSLSGLRAAFRKEAAFRQDVYLCVILGVVAFCLDVTGAQRALLLLPLFILLIAELLNSAMEWTVNLVTSNRHPFAKYAKDMGSAAVFCALVNIAVMWACVLWG